MGLDFHNTPACFSVTHQSPVCPVSIGCVHACACRCFNYGSIWVPIRCVITRPPNKQGLRFVGFVTVYTGINFAHDGANMHRHTRCEWVEGGQYSFGACFRAAGD